MIEVLQDGGEWFQGGQWFETSWVILFGILGGIPALIILIVCLELELVRQVWEKVLAMILLAPVAGLGVLVLVLNFVHLFVEPAATEQVKSAYGIEHIETVSGQAFSSAVMDPNGRSATAVTLTTNEGEHYDRARLVYDIVDEDADPGEVTHRVSIEVADESRTEWLPLEPGEEQ